MLRIIVVLLVISIMLAGCTLKAEIVELVYRFVPTREYLTNEKYVNHLNEYCDDLCKEDNL